MVLDGRSEVVGGYNGTYNVNIYTGYSQLSEYNTSAFSS